MTLKVSPKTRNNPSNPVPSVTADLDSDPSFSYSTFWIHLTHQTTIFLKEYNLRKRIKINVRVKIVSMTLSKSAQTLQPSYLQPHKSQRS